MKPLDIGIASWQSPDKLDTTLTLLRQNTTGEWRVFVIDNNSPDPLVKDVINKHAQQDGRVVPVYLTENVGYVGAVNKLFEIATTQYVAYCDNDAYVYSHGWNEIMMDLLERHHELAMIFPPIGTAYPIQRPDYTEILWGLGCFWMINKIRADEVGGFDTTLGHQEEVDFQMRLRLNGWKCAVTTDVHVVHQAVSSNNPEAKERINQGIINWVNKWNKYFNGPHVNYFSNNVTRFEDWPINALYIEEWFKLQPEYTNFNANAETITVQGREYDLVKVPRYPYLYRDRII